MQKKIPEREIHCVCVKLCQVKKDTDSLMSQSHSLCCVYMFSAYIIKCGSNVTFKYFIPPCMHRLLDTDRSRVARFMDVKPLDVPVVINLYELKFTVRLTGSRDLSKMK